MAIRCGAASRAFRTLSGEAVQIVRPPGRSATRKMAQEILGLMGVFSAIFNLVVVLLTHVGVGCS